MRICRGRGILPRREAYNTEARRRSAVARRIPDIPALLPINSCSVCSATGPWWRQHSRSPSAASSSSGLRCPDHSRFATGSHRLTKPHPCSLRQEIPHVVALPPGYQPESMTVLCNRCMDPTLLTLITHPEARQIARRRSQLGRGRKQNRRPEETSLGSANARSSRTTCRAKPQRAAQGSGWARPNLDARCRAGPPSVVYPRTMSQSLSLKSSPIGWRMRRQAAFASARAPT